MLARISTVMPNVAQRCRNVHRSVRTYCSESHSVQRGGVDSFPFDARVGGVGDAGAEEQFFRRRQDVAGDDLVPHCLRRGVNFDDGGDGEGGRLGQDGVFGDEQAGEEEGDGGSNGPRSAISRGCTGAADPGAEKGQRYRNRNGHDDAD